MGKNYWLTTHWPQRIDDTSPAGTGVWVKDGLERVANDMKEGDRVLIYEFKTGPIEIDVKDGICQRIKRKRGRGSLICYGRIKSQIEPKGDSEPKKYGKGTEIWWRWYAPVLISSRNGSVSSKKVNEVLLVKKPAWNLHGFGEGHSGLKKISESQFNKLVKMFYSSPPVELHKNDGSGGTRHGGGGESKEHLNLKEYVAANTEDVFQEEGIKYIDTEYIFQTNDKADVLLEDKYGRIMGVEVEISVDKDNISGILQAIKYRYMAEVVRDKSPGDSRAILVAFDISNEAQNLCKKYNVECFIIAEDKVKQWDSKT